MVSDFSASKIDRSIFNVQFPARGSTQVFPGVSWLWHFLYIVVPHPVSSLHIYNTFVVSRTFMAGAASQVGDADSSRAPCLTSGLQGSVNVHRGTLLLVPQWQCISSFVFYILCLALSMASGLGILYWYSIWTYLGPVAMEYRWRSNLHCVSLHYLEKSN